MQNGHTLSEVQQYGEAHIAKGISRLTQHVFSEGQGSYITTDKGERFLDLTCGIAVTNLGHCHPKVSAAAADQCMKLTHAQVNIGFSDVYIELVKQLLPRLPDPSLDSVFLWNSGAEAVEASIKLARHATKKQNIIVVQGSYHGRTFGTMALTRSKTIYGEGYAPLMPGVFTTPFPYFSQLGVPIETSEQDMVAQSLLQLKLLLQQQTAPSDTAAIILEPVLGEGGYVPAPKAFLEGLRKTCDEHNMLLIADEVQSGMGRTGKWFAMEHSGVRPDVLVFAKGIANGFPLSGIASRKELMDKQPKGSQGGTYSGNAVAVRAAIEVIKVIEEEKVLENVAARNKQLVSFLTGLASKPHGREILQVRGQGLMIGVEFRPREGGQLAPQLSKACHDRGMLILSTSVFDTLRFIPPLNVSDADLEKACGIFEDALKDVAGGSK